MKKYERGCSAILCGIIGFIGGQFFGTVLGIVASSWIGIDIADSACVIIGVVAAIYFFFAALLSKDEEDEIKRIIRRDKF